ncbi:MAG: DICT sensory domain-containing protein [Cyanobacteria bacterium J06642_9]
MSNLVSVVEQLFKALPTVRPQLYFKTSLTALSHAMEDQVLAGSERPLVIASFQQERFYRQEAHRYQRIADITDQVYVLSAAETSFEHGSHLYETIAFDSQDALTQEWHLIVMGEDYSACLICRERQPVSGISRSPGLPALEQTRRFEGLWTQDRHVTQQAAQMLLLRIQDYRPDLADKLDQARDRFLADIAPHNGTDFETDPFTQRLVTYLQAGQYKLLKAYKAISAQERRERLVNSITAAMRRSLNPAEIFKIAVQELGQAIHPSRCLIYRYSDRQATTAIHHESLEPGIDTLIEQIWPLENNPLFQQVREQQTTLIIPDTQDSESPNYAALKPLKPLLSQWHIRSWLMVPLIYQGRLLGMIELHHCQPIPYAWTDNDVALVEAIATQLSVAIIQADAYANLEVLNQQLAALERTRSNLIAITGHELRTPLSTIQVCLESLSTEPDMPPALQQVMLNAALTDAERMRKLVQDFLTLSRLESGRIEWNLESLSLHECVDLALSSIRAKYAKTPIPTIQTEISPQVPLVKADGEWLVEVLTKLLDNACKFTETSGQITISAYDQRQTPKTPQVEVIVTDTGRGIEQNQLETVFDRFYQEEGALRRTTGGTGLGLAISRQIVEGLGGTIWATSQGKDQGSQFHLTLPAVEAISKSQEVQPKEAPSRRKSVSSKRNRTPRDKLVPDS